MESEKVVLSFMSEDGVDCIFTREEERKRRVEPDPRNILYVSALSMRIRGLDCWAAADCQAKASRVVKKRWRLLEEKSMVVMRQHIDKTRRCQAWLG